MKLIATDEISIKSLRLPGDWRKFTKESTVEERADSIRKTQPVVRASDKRLLAGKVEVAARQRLGLAEVFVQLVDCTDEEAKAIELADASGSRQELTAILVTQIAENLMEAGEADRIEGQGPTKTAKSMARKMIAESEGVQPNTVRMREYRAKNKTPAEPWTFQDLGMQLDPAWLSRVLAVREGLEVVIGKMKIAKASLTALVNSGCGADLPQRVAHIQDDMSQLGASLRGLRPASVCPYCRGLDKVMQECTACETMGYCTEALLPSVPPEYLRTDNPVVLYRTKVTPVSEFVVTAEQFVQDPSSLWPE